MKCEFVSMYPKDNVDEVLIVRMEPRWYEKFYENPPQEQLVRFFGSGHQWWEESSDRRADDWTSNILHDYWNTELNKRIERKNCK